MRSGAPDGRMRVSARAVGANIGNTRSPAHRRGPTGHPWPGLARPGL